MRIGLLSTLHTNFGDDLVREGIIQLLKGAFPDRQIDFVTVNKHTPLTVYPRSHPRRLVHQLARLPSGQTLEGVIEGPLSALGHSVFDDCDAIVQCGTPVVWPHCHECEWAEPIWHQVVGRLSRAGMPVLNLGAGSCYSWENQPAVLEEKDADYVRKILSYCRLTTVRDRLARDLFKNVGQECPHMPCPAFLSGRAYGDEKITGIPSDFILINYMERAGHYDWGQQIDTTTWAQTVQTLVQRLKPQHPLLFLCHDAAEFERAGQMAPGAPRYLAKTYAEYFAVLSRAAVGLCNRLHASVALASLGVPSLSVGNDTRMLMLETLGLPFQYVKNTSAETLADTLHELLVRKNTERDRLGALRARTWDGYLPLIQKALA